MPLRSFEYFESQGDWSKYKTIMDAFISGGNVPTPSQVNKILVSLADGSFNWGNLKDLVESGNGIKITNGSAAGKIKISSEFKQIYDDFLGTVDTCGATKADFTYYTVPDKLGFATNTNQIYKSVVNNINGTKLSELQINDKIVAIVFNLDEVENIDTFQEIGAVPHVDVGADNDILRFNSTTLGIEDHSITCHYLDSTNNVIYDENGWTIDVATLSDLLELNDLIPNNFLPATVHDLIPNPLLEKYDHLFTLYTDSDLSWQLVETISNIHNDQKFICSETASLFIWMDLDTKWHQFSGGSGGGEGKPTDIISLDPRTVIGGIGYNRTIDTSAIEGLDNVISIADDTELPTTADSNILYITEDEHKIWQYDGSAWVFLNDGSGSSDKFLGEFFTADKFLENLPNGQTNGDKAFVFMDSTPPGTGIANSIYSWDALNNEWVFVETIVPTNDTTFFTDYEFPALFIYKDTEFKVFHGGTGSDGVWKYADLTSQIDGVNNSFTLPSDYNLGTPLIAFLNKGVKPGIDYTITNDILTFDTIVPIVGDEFWIYYNLAGSPAGINNIIVINDDSELPTTADSDLFYVTLDNHKVWEYDGTSWVLINAGSSIGNLPVSTWGLRVGETLYHLDSVPNPISKGNDLSIDPIYVGGGAIGLLTPPGFVPDANGDFNFDVQMFPWVKDIVLDSNDKLIGFDIEWGGQLTSSYDGFPFSITMVTELSTLIKDISIGDDLRNYRFDIYGYDPSLNTGSVRQIGDVANGRYLVINADGSLDLEYDGTLHNLILADGTRNDFNSGQFNFTYDELTFKESIVIDTNDFSTGDSFGDYDVSINRMDVYLLDIDNLDFVAYNSDTLYDIDNVTDKMVALVKFDADNHFLNQAPTNYPSSLWQASTNDEWHDPDYTSTENFVKPGDSNSIFNILVSSITPTPIESNLSYGDVFIGANGYRAIYYGWYNDGYDDYVELLPINEFYWEAVSIVASQETINNKADKFLKAISVQVGSNLEGLSFTKTWNPTMITPFEAVLDKFFYEPYNPKIEGDGAGNITYTDSNGDVTPIFTNGFYVLDYDLVFYDNIINSLTGIFPRDLLVRNMNLSDFDNIYSEKYFVNMGDISVGASFSGVYINLPMIVNATEQGYDVSKIVFCEGRSEDLSDPNLYPMEIHFEGTGDGDVSKLNLYIIDSRYGDHTPTILNYAIANGGISQWGYYDIECKNNKLYLPDVIVTDVSNTSFVENAYTVVYGAKQLFDDINGGIGNRNFWWDDKIADNEGIADSITNQLDWLYDHIGGSTDKFLGEFLTADKFYENLIPGTTSGDRAFVFQDSTPPGTGIANSIYVWNQSTTTWDFVETIVPENDTKFLTTDTPTLFIYDGVADFDWFNGSSSTPFVNISSVDILSEMVSGAGLTGLDIQFPPVASIVWPSGGLAFSRQLVFNKANDTYIQFWRNGSGGYYQITIADGGTVYNIYDDNTSTSSYAADQVVGPFSWDQANEVLTIDGTALGFNKYLSNDSFLIFDTDNSGLFVWDTGASTDGIVRPRSKTISFIDGTAEVKKWDLQNVLDSGNTSTTPAIFNFADSNYSNRINYEIPSVGFVRTSQAAGSLVHQMQFSDSGTGEATNAVLQFNPYNGDNRFILQNSHTDASGNYNLSGLDLRDYPTSIQTTITSTSTPSGGSAASNNLKFVLGPPDATGTNVTSLTGTAEVAAALRKFICLPFDDYMGYNIVGTNNDVKLILKGDKSSSADVEYFVLLIDDTDTVISTISGTYSSAATEEYTEYIINGVDISNNGYELDISTEYISPGSVLSDWSKVVKAIPLQSIKDTDKFIGEFWTADKHLEDLPNGDTDGQLGFVFMDSTPPDTGIANSIYEWDATNSVWVFVKTIIPTNDTKFFTTDNSTLYIWDNGFKIFKDKPTAWGTIVGTLSDQADLQAALSAIDTGQFLGPYPNTGAVPTPYGSNDLYLIGVAPPYDIYVDISGTLTQIGSSSVDLTNYYTKTEADALLVLKSGLSTVTQPATGDVSGSFTLNDTGAAITNNLTIGTDKVTTDKIATSAVTNNELADNSVTTIKIADGTIKDVDISTTAAITVEKLFSDASVGKVLTTTTTNAPPTWESIPVDNTKSGLSTITHPSSGDVTGSFTLNNTGAAISDPLTIGANKVLTSMIADNAITTAKINALAVTTAKIADANVTLDKLATNSVDSSKILDYNISVDKLAAGAVTTDKIAASAVTEAKLANYCISNVKILDSAINSAKIADGTIVNADIAAATIEATKLKGSGTVGQILTTTTANAAPTWTTPGAAGVSQITAGTNVTISPVGGTGNVTINASASAGGQAALPDAAIMTGYTCDATGTHAGVISIKYLWELNANGSSTHYKISDAQMAAASSAGLDVQYGYRVMSAYLPDKYTNIVTDIHILRGPNTSGFIRVQYAGGASLLWPRQNQQYDNGGSGGSVTMVPRPWSTSTTMPAPTDDWRAYPDMPWIHETQRMVTIPTSTSTPAYQVMCRIPGTAPFKQIKGSYSTYGTIRVFMRDLYNRDFKTGTNMITAITDCWYSIEGSVGSYNCVEGNTYCVDSQGEYIFDGVPMGHKFAGCSDSWYVDGNEILTSGIPTTCLGTCLAWEVTDMWSRQL